MSTNQPPEPPSPENSFVEQAIVVRAIRAMREHDPQAAPDNAQITHGHVAFARAMREALARGKGSVTTLEFDALGIVYEVLGCRSTRITVMRRAVSEPYPSEAFASIRRLPDMEMKDRGDGSYVFDIETRHSDSEHLREIAAVLENGNDKVNLSDAEARELGLLPPHEN